MKYFNYITSKKFYLNSSSKISYFYLGKSKTFLNNKGNLLNIFLLKKTNFIIIKTKEKIFFWRVSTHFHKNASTHAT